MVPAKILEKAFIELQVITNLFFKKTSERKERKEGKKRRKEKKERREGKKRREKREKREKRIPSGSVFETKAEGNIPQNIFPH